MRTIWKTNVGFKLRLHWPFCAGVACYLVLLYHTNLICWWSILLIFLFLLQKPKAREWHPPGGFILGLWALILLVFFKTYGIKHMKHIFWALWRHYKYYWSSGIFCTGVAANPAVYLLLILSQSWVFIDWDWPKTQHGLLLWECSGLCHIGLFFFFFFYCSSTRKWSPSTAERLGKVLPDVWLFTM